MIRRHQGVFEPIIVDYVSPVWLFLGFLDEFMALGPCFAGGEEMRDFFGDSLLESTTVVLDPLTNLFMLFGHILCHTEDNIFERFSPHDWI